MKALGAIFDVVPGWAYAVLLALALVLIGGMKAQNAGLGAALASARLEAEKGRADRAEAARVHEQQVSTKEYNHAATTLKAVEQFALGAPVRDYSLRAELADAHRLRDAAEGRAAHYRALSEAGAAERERLSNQCAALDRELAEGRGVVAQLRGDLARRDAEVALLVENLSAERALLTGFESVR